LHKKTKELMDIVYKGDCFMFASSFLKIPLEERIPLLNSQYREGYTCFIKIATLGRVDILKFILDNANKKEKESLILKENEYGYNSIAASLYSKKFDVTKILLFQAFSLEYSLIEKILFLDVKDKKSLGHIAYKLKWDYFLKFVHPIHNFKENFVKNPIAFALMIPITQDDIEFLKDFFLYYPHSQYVDALGARIKDSVSVIGLAINSGSEQIITLILNQLSDDQLLDIFTMSFNEKYIDILTSSLISQRTKITTLILERLFQFPEELLINILSAYSNTGNTLLMKIILESNLEIINFIGMHIPLTTFAELLVNQKNKRGASMIDMFDDASKAVLVSSLYSRELIEEERRLVDRITKALGVECVVLNKRSSFLEKILMEEKSSAAFNLP